MVPQGSLSTSGQQQVAEGSATRTPIIREGVCHVLYAYDVGLSINLEQCAQRITAMTQREPIKHKKRAPTQYSEYPELPLRVSQAISSVDVGVARTTESAEIIIHDFGVITVQFAFDIAGPFIDLLPLSEHLYENATLLAASRRIVTELCRTIQPAIARPSFARPVEDYTIYDVRKLEGTCTTTELMQNHRQLIAQILRSETTPLSQQETEDALACSISFAPDDYAIIDWNGALLLDANSDDTNTVLELANAELLEMRFLDTQLDDAMEEAYRTFVMQQQRSWWGRKRAAAADLRRISRLQVDNALLFEVVHNAMKLLGDQYLARVYRLASQRFHLREWDESIVRKLQTLESVYQKMTDRTTSLRMEVLEWIIIVLIAVSIVLPFFIKY